MRAINFNYSELRGKIKAVCDTQEAFADAMGMSRSAISQRLNNSVEWSTPEIVKACEVLHIELADAYIYFFSTK